MLQMDNAHFANTYQSFLCLCIAFSTLQNLTHSEVPLKVQIKMKPVIQLAGTDHFTNEQTVMEMQCHLLHASWLNQTCTEMTGLHNSHALPNFTASKMSTMELSHGMKRDEVPGGIFQSVFINSLSSSKGESPQVVKNQSTGIYAVLK